MAFFLYPEKLLISIVTPFEPTILFFSIEPLDKDHPHIEGKFGVVEDMCHLVFFMPVGNRKNIKGCEKKIPKQSDCLKKKSERRKAKKGFIP